MTPAEFNAEEWQRGRLRFDHVSEMTRIAQRALGLPVDGKCGPATRNALESQLSLSASLAAEFPTASPTAIAAVEVALSLRGRGEEGANNAGPFIRELGGRDGFLWCALLAGHCWREAHRIAGLVPPAWTFRRAGVAEPGAQALVQAAVAASSVRVFVDASKALPGDLALWTRDGGHHVALVWRPLPGGTVATVEGNVGPFPARVRDLVHDVSHEPHFVGFARPPRL